MLSAMKTAGNISPPASRSLLHRSQAAKALHTNRSKVTNGVKLLRHLDLRSHDGRRYRDLVDAFKAEFGSGLTEGQMAPIRLAAALTVQSEAMQAAIVRGERVDREELTRLANAQTRALRALAAMKPRAAAVTVHDVLLGAIGACRDR